MSTNPHSFRHISRANVQVKQTQGPGLSIAMVVIHRAGSVTTWTGRQQGRQQAIFCQLSSLN